MAAHSSILVCEVPWAEGPGELQSLGHKGLHCQGFPGGSDDKESVCNAGDLGSIPGSGRPWRRKWQPTAVFLSGRSLGHRSLVGYSPWGCKESDVYF